ncbi:hypothetical protein C8R43DRAFT_1017231 [Mycena crocata]|nr:hypothetical protein C8R43DRAFT_1017231 [Mycena crocata]
MDFGISTGSKLATESTIFIIRFIKVRLPGYRTHKWDQRIDDVTETVSKLSKLNPDPSDLRNFNRALERYEDVRSKMAQLDNANKNGAHNFIKRYFAAQGVSDVGRDTRNIGVVNQHLLHSSPLLTAICLQTTSTEIKRKRLACLADHAAFKRDGKCTRCAERTASSVDGDAMPPSTATGFSGATHLTPDLHVPIHRISTMSSAEFEENHWA